MHSNPMACAVDKTITSPGSLNVALHLSAWTDRRMVGADVFDGFRIGFMSAKRSCLGEMLQWEGNHANATYCTRFFSICRFVISVVELNFPMLLCFWLVWNIMKRRYYVLVCMASFARKCSWLLWLWVSVPLSQLPWEAFCDLASMSIDVDPCRSVVRSLLEPHMDKKIASHIQNWWKLYFSDDDDKDPLISWLYLILSFVFWFEVDVSFGQTRFALELMMPRLYDTSSYSACFFASTFGTFDA